MPVQNRTLKIYSSDQYLLAGHGNQVELLYHGANWMILNHRIICWVNLGKVRTEKNLNLSVLSEFKL